MPGKFKNVLFIALVDTYIILISFAVIKVLELMFKSFWVKEIQLQKIMGLTLSLPILLAYTFLLTFDLSEYFLRNRKGEKSNESSSSGNSK